MTTTYSKTAIALQGGGALGAYSFGALKYIYESEPNLQLSSVSGVSIGAFTAAIVASHPDNPIGHLQSFWKDLTVFHSNLLPAQVERFFSYFGNPNFYLPRQGAEAWDRSTAPGATSRSTISSASVRLQRLRLACRSGAQLIPILVMAGPVLAMHVFGQVYSIHFERGPPCQKKRSRRRNRKPN